MPIPIENYKKRRKECIERMNQISNGEKACMILYSPPERRRNGDTHYPYRFSSDIFFLSGLRDPEVILMIRNQAPHSVAFILPKDPKKEVWTGIRKSTDQVKEEFHIDEVFTIDKAETELINLLEGCDHLFISFIDRETSLPKLPNIIQQLKARYHVNPEIGKELHSIMEKGIITNSSEADKELIDKMKDLKSKKRPGVNHPSHLHDAHKLLSDMRRHKTKEEVDAIRRAITLSEKAYIDTIGYTKPGMNEHDVLAHLEYEFIKNGGEDVGYLSIVAGGINATILHYTENDMELKDDMLLLIDAGAEKEGYTADITRTFPVGKNFTPRQRDVYDAVLEVQRKVIDMVKPGISIHELNEASAWFTVEALIDLKVLTGDVETLFLLDSYKPFYMHGVSHFLGLDVHDVGSYYSKIDKPEPLRPGAVITVEPGLYFGKIAEDYAPKELYGIGIRIEDDILVTEDGHENLVKNLPKTASDIENLK
jgi:Xaa-Pro aminopeptidase